MHHLNFISCELWLSYILWASSVVLNTYFRAKLYVIFLSAHVLKHILDETAENWYLEGKKP